MILIKFWSKNYFWDSLLSVNFFQYFLIKIVGDIFKNMDAFINTSSFYVTRFCIERRCQRYVTKEITKNLWSNNANYLLISLKFIKTCASVLNKRKTIGAGVCGQRNGTLQKKIILFGTRGIMIVKSLDVRVRRCVQKITGIFLFRGFGESYCQILFYYHVGIHAPEVW